MLDYYKYFRHRTGNMELSDKFVRKHMERLKPLTENASLEACRKGQDIWGMVLAKTMRKCGDIHDIKLSHSDAAWIHPHDELKKESFYICTAEAIPAAILSMPRASVQYCRWNAA